jgi:hypothetical protein
MPSFVVRPPVAARLAVVVPAAASRLPAGTVRTYTQGQCTALAIALSEQTGWPIVALACLDMYALERCAPADPVSGILGSVASLDLADSFVHAAVLAPDGRVLDVTGFHSMRELVSAWSDDDDFELSERDGEEAELAEDRLCGPDCVCPDWCLEDVDVRVVFTSAGNLLDARAAGGWPVPRLDAARRVADRLLGVGQSRSR